MICNLIQKLKTWRIWRYTGIWHLARWLKSFLERFEIPVWDLIWDMFCPKRILKTSTSCSTLLWSIVYQIWKVHKIHPQLNRKTIRQTTVKTVSSVIKVVMITITTSTAIFVTINKRLSNQTIVYFPTSPKQCVCTTLWNRKTQKLHLFSVFYFMRLQPVTAWFL